MKKTILTLLGAAAFTAAAAQTAPAQQDGQTPKESATLPIRPAAPERLTPELYRQQVLDYSFSVKMTQAAAGSAYENSQRAKKAYLPALSASGDFSVQFREQTTGSGDNTAKLKPWSFALQPEIVQTLYGGGSVKNAYRQSLVGYDEALLQTEFSKIDVAYAADYAYWNLSATEELFKATRQYVEIIRGLRGVIRRRFDDGYIGKGDLLQIDARLSDAEYNYVSAEQGYRTALNNFNILRGHAPGTEVALAQNVFALVARPGRVPADSALMQRPDYLAALRRVDYNAFGVKLAAAAYNPQVQAGVSGVWKSRVPNVTGSARLDAMAFLRLSVPIFAWGERRHAVAVAEGTVRSSEYAARSAADQIAQEEANAWLSINQSATQVSTSYRSLEIARENLDLSTYSYNEGQATILDVLSAQLSWIQLYTNAVTANFNHKVTIAQYRRAVGDRQ